MPMRALRGGKPLAVGWVALALTGCLLTSPLDDVEDGAAGDGGRGGAAPGPLGGAMSGGTGGSLLSGGAGSGGSSTIPLEEWCPDPVELWAVDNPYWATYVLVPEESVSDSCAEPPAGEFVMSQDQAEEGCEIADSILQPEACGYGELQRCESNGVQLVLFFLQAAPDAPLEGALLVYPLDASKGAEPACSYVVTLVPQSEL